MAAVQSDVLVESLRLPGTAMISPERVASILGLQMQELAEIAGVHRNTLRTHPESPGVQAWARRVVRVLRMAEDVNGDPERTAYLFRNAPIPPLGYLTALDMVKAGRFDDLAKYLQTVSAGFVG